MANYELSTAILEHGDLMGADVRAYASTCKIANQCLTECNKRAVSMDYVNGQLEIRQKSVCGQLHGLRSTYGTFTKDYAVFNYGDVRFALNFKLDMHSDCITVSKSLRDNRLLCVEVFYQDNKSIDTFNEPFFDEQSIKEFDLKAFITNQCRGTLLFAMPDGVFCEVMTQDKNDPQVLVKCGSVYKSYMIGTTDMPEDPLISAAISDLIAML